MVQVWGNLLRYILLNLYWIKLDRLIINFIEIIRIWYSYMINVLFQDLNNYEAIESEYDNN